MATLELHCETCARLRVFEQPSCPEGHGTDCADWACSRCGGAVVVAPVIMLIDRRPTVLVQQRRRYAA